MINDDIIFWAVMYWILAALYCVWRTNKELPHIEKKIVDSQDYYNALGEIPKPIKHLVCLLTILCSPVLAPFFALDHLREIQCKWKARGLLKQLKFILERVKNEIPNHPDIPKMEMEIKKIEDAIR